MDIAPFQPVDMISNLPDIIVDDILMRLTIRDAVRTSILSKQWRYKWVNLPQLVFDDTLWGGFLADGESARRKFATILVHVFCFHQGPITKFSLITQKLESCSEIDHLIFYLSKNGVEEFCLQIERGYKLRSSLFMCTQLKHLTLSSCVITCPPSFKGFNSLIRLELLNVTIDTEVRGTLISSCPLLEQLKLDVRDGFYLEIDAPKLRHFELINFTNVCFKNSPLLATVLISGNSRVDRMEDVTFNFIGFFDSLPSLQEFDVGMAFTGCFDAHQVPTTLPSTLNNLRTLKLRDVNLRSLKVLACTLCLIRSSPNLEKLILNFSHGAIGGSGVLDFLKVQDFSNSFDRLQHVEVKFMCECEWLLEKLIINLLLRRSPKLKRVAISWGGEFDRKLLRILKDLNNFCRASPNAKIDIQTPYIE